MERISVTILTGLVLLILSDTIRFYTQTARQSLLLDLTTRICDKVTMEPIHIASLAYFAAITLPSFNAVLTTKECSLHHDERPTIRLYERGEIVHFCTTENIFRVASALGYPI